MTAQQQADREQLVVQFIKHFDRHWYGINHKKTYAKVDILAALNKAGLGTEGFVMPDLSMLAYQCCEFWLKKQYSRKRSIRKDNHFSWNEWDAMFKWINANHANFSYLDTSYSISARMRHARLASSPEGAMEAMQFMGRTIKSEPPQFIFKKGPSL